MNKKILCILVGVLIVSFTFTISATCAKKPEIVVNGVFFWTGAPVPEMSRETPNGMILRGTVPLMYTGSFVGPAIGEFVWNTHTQRSVTGRNFHTINTATGSLLILLSNSNSRWRIISGTGAYESIHGTGTFVADESTEFSFDFIYTGNVHFDP